MSPTTVAPVQIHGDRTTFVWRVEGLHVRAEGEIDATTAPAFGEALAACERLTHVAALDLSEITRCTVAGVRCLLARGWHERPHPIVIASPSVRRALESRNLTFLLDLHGWAPRSALVGGDPGSADHGVLDIA